MDFVSLAIIFASVIFGALVLDDVIPLAWFESLANFPFRGLAATNGAVLGILLFTIEIGLYYLAARFSSQGGL